MQFGKSNFWVNYGFTLVAAFFVCSCNNAGKKFASGFSARDTTDLIQTMLDNKRLNDSLFSGQISQNLIVYKDNRIPAGAVFTYQGKPVLIREEKIERKYIDFEHPRFIIAFGKCVINDTAALLSFDMPDVGMGISTHWKRNDKNTPWILADWSDAHY